MKKSGGWIEWKMDGTIIRKRRMEDRRIGGLEFGMVGQFVYLEIKNGEQKTGGLEPGKTGG